MRGVDRNANLLKFVVIANEDTSSDFLDLAGPIFTFSVVVAVPLSKNVLFLNFNFDIDGQKNIDG